MPTIHREAGFAFYFYAGDLGHRPHIHVRAGRSSATIDLVPLVRVRECHGYTRPQVGKITAITQANRARWLAAWHTFFRGA